jgi:hypothetical protein
MFKIMQQENSVADNAARDLFKINILGELNGVGQATVFTAYIDYVVISGYQETVESGRFLITGGRRYASGNAVCQIEKVYSDTADLRGGGESITVTLAATLGDIADNAIPAQNPSHDTTENQAFTYAMTVDTQHGNSWNCKWNATIMGGYSIGGSSQSYITVDIV